MPINDIIKEAEYNSIRNKVIGIMGTGSGNSGYGQTLLSSAVAVGNRVTINEWANLRYDIINAYVHQNGSNPTTVTVAEGNTIRYSSIDAPVTTYDTLADGLITNKFSAAVSQMATNIPSLPSSTSWPGGGYGNTWTTKIQCTMDFVWPTANDARYFFNSGGQLRVTSSRTGGSSTAQCLSWTSILSTAGTVSFGGNNPGTGTSPANGQNWFRLGSAFQQYYTTSGSSPYGSNTYRLSARATDVVSNATGTSKSMQIFAEFIDNYVDPGNYPLDVPNTVDAVDGTFQVSVSLLYATGVLVPSGTGNFAVTLPTVAIGAVAPP